MRPATPTRWAATAADVVGSIERLEQQQDDLLDRLNEAVG